MHHKVRKFSREGAQPHPQTYTTFLYLTPIGASILAPAATDTRHPLRNPWIRYCPHDLCANTGFYHESE